MSTLVLELRQGEMMIINGAPIRFRTKARLELAARARFLFGKQIMSPDQADTPARRIYFALQCAYVGTEVEERAAALESARDLVAQFSAATTSEVARLLLGRALELAERDECYQALRLVRRVIRHEDTVLEKPQTAPLDL